MSGTMFTSLSEAVFVSIASPSAIAPLPTSSTPIPTQSPPSANRDIPSKDIASYLPHPSPVQVSDGHSHSIHIALGVSFGVLFLLILLLSLYLFRLRRAFHRSKPPLHRRSSSIDLDLCAPRPPTSTISRLSSTSSKSTRARPHRGIPPVPPPPPGIFMQRDVDLSSTKYLLKDGAVDPMKLDVNRANEGYWNGRGAVGSVSSEIQPEKPMGENEEEEKEEKEEEIENSSMRNRECGQSGVSSIGGDSIRNRVYGENGVSSIRGDSGNGIQWVIEPRSPRRVVDRQVREMSEDWQRRYGW